MEMINKNNYEAYWLDYIEGNLDEATTEALFAFFEKFPELKPDSQVYDLPVLESETEHFENKSSLKHVNDEIEEEVVAYLDKQITNGEELLFLNKANNSATHQKLMKDYAKTFITPSGEESLHTFKTLLKKSIIEEEQLIAYTEEQLNKEETLQLQTELKKDDVAMALLALYQKTKIEADLAIQYPHKESLKKEAELFVLYSWKTISIAASILLIIGLFWLFNNDTSIHSAQKTEQIIANNNSGEKNIAPSIKKEERNAIALAPVNTDLPKNKPTIKKRISEKHPVNKETVMPSVPENTTENLNVAVVNTESAKNQEPETDIASALSSHVYINLFDVTDNPGVNNQQRNIGPSEFLTEKINEAAWGSGDEPELSGGKKLRGMKILALIGNGLKKLGSKHSGAEKIEHPGEDYTEYIVNIGNFSFRKNVSN